jgi:hypothetical protein
LKKEKRQQAGAEEKSLLTAERERIKDIYKYIYIYRETEREREEKNCDRKSGLEARAKSHTLKKNNHAGHVFRVDFLTLGKTDTLMC